VAASDEEDPLLSVTQVARLYGTGLRVVVSLVEQGVLPSLDGARLVSVGRLDVPLIRRSWAVALQKDSRGASRRLDDRDGVHPAAEAALEFHAALDLNDAERVYELSSRASRHQRAPGQLLDEWRRELAHVFAEPSGIGTAVYSLAPRNAVVVRILGDPPPIPRAVTAPTPAWVLAIVPFVPEDDGWKADLPMYQDRNSWTPLLDTPMPQDDDGS
jgi:hypothetical protein